jgi:glycosyltransferase involved in cell wall biosynthesis
MKLLETDAPVYTPPVKLFVYIPTYNRPEALKRQLDVLMPQIKDRGSNVRVLINDNDSSGREVDKIVAEYRNFDNVEARKNGGNIGGNANIALGFSFARPDEFLWILSDNDTITTSAITYILSQLNKGIDFLCYNKEVEDAVDVEHHWRSGWEVPMHWRMGLISDGMYNMATVRKVVDQAFYFHNSSFPHLAVACAAARSKGSVQFRLLPRGKMIKEEYSSKEEPTDYSLANVCMPLLVALFPAWEAKSFSRKWLLKHGIQMHIKKNMHPHLYIQSAATIRKYGGYRAVLLLWATSFAAIIAKPYIKNRATLVEMLRNKLSRTDYNYLKNVKRVLCGK